MQTVSDTNPPLALHVSAFCQRIGISRATFYAELKKGRIRVIRVGGRTLVPWPEVQRILQGDAHAAR